MLPALSSPARTLRRRAAVALCAAVLAGLPLGALADTVGPKAASLELAPAVQVDGTGIHLDQLFSATTVQALPHLRLANPPAVGQTVSFSRGQVLEFLRQHAGDAAPTNVGGSAAVRVTRRTRALDETSLKDLLTATLQREVVKDRGELELRLSRPWTPVSVPDDLLSLRILDAPTAMLGPSLLVRFELLAGSDRLGSWQMVAQAKVWRDVLVARTVARRGSLVRDADFAVERRDLLTVRDTLPLDSAQDASLELVENLQPGQPVLSRSVRVRPLIQRGQLVDALVRDGGLTITLKVETLEDGLPGQTVRVRNPKTRRELLGKVHDEQTVLVIL